MAVSIISVGTLLPLLLTFVVIFLHTTCLIISWASLKVMLFFDLETTNLFWTLGHAPFVCETMSPLLSSSPSPSCQLNYYTSEGWELHNFLFQLLSLFLIVSNIWCTGSHKPIQSLPHKSLPHSSTYLPACHLLPLLLLKNQCNYTSFQSIPHSQPISHSSTKSLSMHSLVTSFSPNSKEVGHISPTIFLSIIIHLLSYCSLSEECVMSSVIKYETSNGLHTIAH